MSSQKWKRPDDVPYPTVWHTFKAKDMETDELVEYRVQDLTEKDFEKAYQSLMKVFLKDEAMNHVMELWKDEASLKCTYDIWKEMVTQRVSLVCYRENSDELVGCNLLYISFGHNEVYETTAKKFDKVQQTMVYAISKAPNLLEKYNVDKYLGAFGLSVDPNYRGRGIATEILKARVPLCKGLGIKLTSNAFTGPASQAAARKAGFKTDFSITYEELTKHGFDYPGINAKTLDLMSLKIE